MDEGRSEGTGPVRIDPSTCFGDGRLGLIAGPCVIESREHCLRMAEAVSRIAGERRIPCLFKSSYDKANRTSVSSYRGPGLQEGLRILEEARDAAGLPVLTDVHAPAEAEAAADAVDVLQIPAFLCRQTDLVLAAGRSGRPVNVKKGQFLAPWEMRHVVEKLESTGNRRLLLTERGTSFGYNNLVVDFKGLPIMARLGYPVVFDVTHSLQLPGGGDGETEGQVQFATTLASAAVAAAADVLFIEVHDDPTRARSDAATQLSLGRLPALLDRARRIHAAVDRGDASGVPGEAAKPTTAAPREPSPVGGEGGEEGTP